MPHPNTEPFEQLLRYEDVQAARVVNHGRKRKQNRRDYEPTHRSVQDGPQGPACDYAPELTEFAHPKDSMSVVTFLQSFVDDRIQQTKGYRLVISLSITVLFLIFGAAYGKFESLGVNGFARADVIKSKIEAATNPIEEEIAKQTALLNSVATQLTESLAAGTASEIRLNLSKLCSEPSGAERERLNKEIDRLQDRYFTLKLFRYLPPPCSQL